MSPALLSLAAMFCIVAAGTAAGFLGGRGRSVNLEQWLLGARGFGAALVFLLMAGEVYTTYTFLGVSGWTYSRGGPILYTLAFITLGQVVAFFIAPRIWELGKRTGMQTQPDFFALRYRNRWLAGFVCVIGIAALVPYLQLQIIGVGIIASMTSFGAIGRTAAMVTAVILLVAFVFANGVRAVASVSILKDGLMLLCGLAIGIGLPLAHFGGIGPMFAALARAHPQHLTLPGETTNLGHAWYVSTVLMAALGGPMWPHLFGATFTARSADALRRNFMVMPLYTLVSVLMIFAGFTAYLVIPHLANGDLAMLTLVRATFPPWFLGLVGGAGALAAMVPASIFILTSASLFAKNLFKPVVAPRMSELALCRLARVMVVVIGAVSLALAIGEPVSLVSLFLIGTACVAQFFPGVLLGLYWKRVTAAAVSIGMASGIALLCFLMLTHRDPFQGLNAGFLGLCLNALLTVLVSLLIPASDHSGRAVASALET